MKQIGLQILSEDLPAQSPKSRHQKKIENIFKLTINEVVDVVLVSLNFEHILHLFLVFTLNFELINVWWTSIIE